MDSEPLGLFDQLIETIDEYRTYIIILILVGSIVGSFILKRVYDFIAVLDCDLTTYYFANYGDEPAKKLRGQVIWISGACSGIGEQLAYDFTKMGCKLVLSGHMDSLNKIKEKCLKIKADAHILTLDPFDIRDHEMLKSAVDQVICHFKQIDILVNNVGRSQRAEFTEITPQMDEEMFSINVFGQIQLSRLVLKQFLKQKSGHFVVTSSVAGKFGGPFSATYTGTKYALIGYFETIRMEYYSQGIHVSTICPGPVVSPLITNSFHSATFSEDVKKAADLKEGKMELKRFTFLMSVAIAHQLRESWISLRPILWFVYCTQYFPSLSKMIMLRFLPVDTLYNIRKGNEEKKGK